MKTAILRVVSAGLTFAFLHTLTAQEQLGLRMSDHGGILSARINPAGTLTHPANWEINLSSAGFHLSNNYVGLPGTNARRLLRDLPDNLYTAVSEAPPTTLTPVFREDVRRHHLSFLCLAEGPAFSVRVGDRHAFGFFTRFQARLSSFDIPAAYSYGPYTRHPLHAPFPVHPFQGAAAAWSETGLNYAWKRAFRNGHAGFGANFRLLKGYVAGYLQSFIAYTHNKTEAYRIALDHAHGRFGYASSYFDQESPALAPTGSGFATDIGFYRFFDQLPWAKSFRVGMSLLDLGSIRFSRHAFAHQVYTREPRQVYMGDYEHVRRPDELPQVIRRFSQDMLGDSLASLRTGHFTMVLPAAASLQASVALPGNFHLQALLVNRLSGGRIALQRNNLLALLPRFETRWVSVAMPLTWYNFEHLRAGLSLRLGPLSIGTDHLGAWVGTRRTSYGADLYAAVRLTPFLPALLRKGPPPLSRTRGRVRCYRF